MNNLTQAIKAMIQSFFDSCSKPREINNEIDYRTSKRWVKKMRTLYIVFTVFAVIESIIFILIPNESDLPDILSKIIFPPALLLTNWGFATMINYLPEIIKSVSEAGKAGYEVGETVETTHVEVTHEYGNNYRVSAHTENKGCLFAFIAGMIKFMIWSIFCVYVGPFLTFKKIAGTVNNMKNYSPEQ